MTSQELLQENVTRNDFLALLVPRPFFNNLHFYCSTIHTIYLILVSEEKNKFGLFYVILCDQKLMLAKTQKTDQNQFYLLCI